MNAFLQRAFPSAGKRCGLAIDPKPQTGGVTKLQFDLPSGGHLHLKANETGGVIAAMNYKFIETIDRHRSRDFAVLTSPR